MLIYLQRKRSLQIVAYLYDLIQLHCYRTDIFYSFFAELQNASKQDDTQEETAETEIDNEETTSSIGESDSLELSEKLSKTESEEERKEGESIKEKEGKETPSHEKQKEETSDSGWYDARFNH